MGIAFERKPPSFLLLERAKGLLDEGTISKEIELIDRECVDGHSFSPT